VHEEKRKLFSESLKRKKLPYLSAPGRKREREKGRSCLRRAKWPLKAEETPLLRKQK